MKVKKVNRYYCDFCKKKGLHAGFMRKHEKGCTANPERVCGFCHFAGYDQRPIKEMISILNQDIPVEDRMEKLREYANDCPACILSAIRQSGLQKFDPDETGCNQAPDFEFDFKKEAAKFWEEHQDNQEYYERNYL